MDCILCLKLLYEPVTTPCGHSFCRPCFLRASDHSTKCVCCPCCQHCMRLCMSTQVDLCSGEHASAFTWPVCLSHSFPEMPGWICSTRLL